MKKVLVVVNVFVHDFASALWLATILAVYWIERAASSPGVEEILFGLKKEFFFFGIGSLVVTLLTGAVRTLTYAEGIYGVDAEKMRKRILIVKHIFAFVIYGTGTWLQYRMVYGA